MLRVTGCGLRVTGYVLRVTCCALRVACFGIESIVLVVVLVLVLEKTEYAYKIRWGDGLQVTGPALYNKFVNLCIWFLSSLVVVLEIG